MADRKRKRTIIGSTEIPCPHCGGGPLILTSSRYRKRLRDVLNPRFDAKVAYREVCQACRMRFTVSTDVRPGVVRSAALTPAAPAPLFAAADEPAPEDDAPVRPATPIRSSKPTQAAFFTDDDELDED
ncbi:hypothetical protein TEK04_15830 [Klenkia sp. LSe6-5]|uniref:Uncharacterized protein n=1 Tax=Klenkia sesuvii TaxID=3103137 RepID=A0ABU8DXH4_9ACTN